MSRFLQLHLLTSYPPSNLNRDDLGRPKTAVMGGAQRLRVSSQSLKRAWRTSEVFAEAVKGHVGTRTKRLGVELFQMLRERGIAEAKAKTWAGEIAKVFGDLDGDGLEIKQLAHVSPEERQAADALVSVLAERGDGPTAEELDLLRKRHTAADIALFGRMLASKPAFNVEAAAQVAHAITVHKVAVEDDYFTAVDDLNSRQEDLGAAHLGETEFAAGLFYLYICINRELLRENLGGDRVLADQALAALVEAAATVAPSGKQNSFGSRAYASYLLAEKGDRQPRSLSVAFLKPVAGQDMLTSAIEALESKRAAMDQVYGACADASYTLNAEQGEGRLQDLTRFVTE
jgi:CRISPR system Cascade subunit CasC